MSARVPKGWYSWVPSHIDQPGLIQVITFRLADSLPRAADQWKRNEAPEAPRETSGGAGCGVEAAYWDAGGERGGGIPLYHDGKHYHLLAWVVMPNHVHVLAETITGCHCRIVRQWKTYTARTINDLRSGPSGRATITTGSSVTSDIWGARPCTSTPIPSWQDWSTNLHCGLTAAPASWRR